jgi:hypothetical protein
MAETSDRNAPGRSTADEPPPPPILPAADAREREATELAALRRQYSRASSYRRPGQGITSRKPETAFGRVVYNIARFWSRQVSVTVPHEACRDHLGTALFRSLLSIRRSAFLFQASEAAFRTPCIRAVKQSHRLARVKSYLSLPRRYIFEFIYRRSSCGGSHRVASATMLRYNILCSVANCPLQLLNGRFLVTSGPL